MDQETVYIKLTLETYKNDSDIQNKFRSLCDSLKNKYSHYIRFLDAVRRFDNNCLYKFDSEPMTISFNKKNKPDILLKKFC